MDFRTAEGKAFKATSLGKELIDYDEGLAALTMRDNLRGHLVIGELLKRGSPQVTFRATPGAFDVQVQARPDWYSAQACRYADAQYTADVKTTDDFSEWYDEDDPESDRISRPIIKWGYHRQAAIVHWLLKEETGKDSDQFIIIAEKQAPHRVGVVQLTSEWIDLGLREVERDIARLALCMKNNLWPSSPEHVIRPEIPGWYLRDSDRATSWNS
jgi:hypothetical protein